MSSKIIDATAKSIHNMSEKERQDILLPIRTEKKEQLLSTNSNPTWRKNVPGGHRLKFVMDSGAAKTIIPKDAVPGMKLDKSKGGFFRVASGNVIPNLGSTRLDGTGTLNGSPMKISTQVAEFTKPLASVNEVARSGVMVIMHRTGGVAKRLRVDTERTTRDLVKRERGNEVVPERSGGAFSFEIEVKIEDKKSTASAAATAGWSTPNPRKTTRAGNQKVGVDDTQIDKSYYSEFFEEDTKKENNTCTPCGASFVHRH